MEKIYFDITVKREEIYVHGDTYSEQLGEHSSGLMTQPNQVHQIGG
jgi:hypothetical protein